MKLALLDRLLALHDAGVPAALVTALADGRQALLSGSDTAGELVLDDTARAAVRDLIAGDRSGSIETAAGACFVEIWTPPPVLLLVGAVHIAQALVPLARAASFRPVIVDPRRAFATRERFPGAELVHDWPDDAIARLAPDRRTAVVTLTHDPKIDDPALAAALRSDAFYVGALGSRRTHQRRRERLAAAGLDGAALERIRGPVGLAIGAVTPAEIAVSVMAEIIAVRRGHRSIPRGW